MNFALILLVLVIVTGIAWVFDKLVFEKQRRRAADAAVADFDQQQARLEPRFADENAPETRARLRDGRRRRLQAVRSYMTSWPSPSLLVIK